MHGRTYDEYSSELSSGHLSWSPVHESDMFWKENAAKLNDKDYEQLKYVWYTSISSCTLLTKGVNRTLIKLLKDSNDPTVLAVASHDVGQYVKHYQPGKKSVPQLCAFHPLTDRCYSWQGADDLGREGPCHGADVALQPRCSLPGTGLRATTCQPSMGYCVRS